ncbi:MAG: hypothetical protein RBR43_07050 [Desulfuromonadaceae bacterium]|nr:hypothetical protein [Desulfuromonadaceae bacterium]
MIHLTDADLAHIPPEHHPPVLKALQHGPVLYIQPKKHYRTPTL